MSVLNQDPATLTISVLRTLTISVLRTLPQYIERIDDYSKLEAIASILEDLEDLVTDKMDKLTEPQPEVTGGLDMDSIVANAIANAVAKYGTPDNKGAETSNVLPFVPRLEVNDTKASGSRQKPWRVIITDMDADITLSDSSSNGSNLEVGRRLHQVGLITEPNTEALREQAGIDITKLGHYPGAKFTFNFDALADGEPCAYRVTLIGLEGKK